MALRFFVVNHVSTLSTFGIVHRLEPSATRYHSDTIILMAMTLRLTEKLDAELEKIAVTQGVSKQQLIVDAIEDYLERNFHEREYDEAFERMMKRHAGVIERLRET